MHFASPATGFPHSGTAHDGLDGEAAFEFRHEIAVVGAGQDRVFQAE